MQTIRNKIRANIRKPESACIKALLDSTPMPMDLREKITARAIQLVKDIRKGGNNSLMELFLEEYGLSTDEGVALMCLAEALLRVPDTDTIDALIEDKISPSEWGQHLGHSSSSLVNASTWALMITGSVLDEGKSMGIGRTLRGAIKRLGEPVIRTAVSRAMKELGAQFVLGRDIEEAMKRAAKQEKRGYTYSYDMLGEAAMTESDAKRFHLAYSRAITALAPACTSDDIRENPGISVKLSALFPRYEEAQRERVMDILVPRTRSLALLAKSVGMGFNIDAEEADRLELSLDVIEAVLSDPSLADWDGFGVVVQAYGKRAPFVLDWLYALSQKLDRRIMVRLVKGAYWDTEIKKAQVLGLDGFPVFTNKSATDVSYIACAQKLLNMTDRIYPQFATHNARTVAAVLEMASDPRTYEFQRLHGMGEALHEIVHSNENTRCRIYAPVGPHKDLLAYLVRRLLENGANSSFVNQIVDESVPPEVVAADPIKTVLELPKPSENPNTVMPTKLFAPDRKNSRGFDLTDPVILGKIFKDRAAFESKRWKVTSLLDKKPAGGDQEHSSNPTNPKDIVADVQNASETDVSGAIASATPWDATVTERAKVLNKAADLYEENYDEIFALLAREAGKTLADCDAELREAVDFLRFYAQQANANKLNPRGVFTCISPWNFPVAIFTGQISAALAAGNAVLAKPAEQTPTLAWYCVNLLHQAGVPKTALQLLIGKGSVVGAALTSAPSVSGICFTGSTATAQTIHRAMAGTMAPETPLIAETGGLNAMIVDSTALPEQAVRDIVASSFQSAGQRCSALRCLYVQDDVADTLLKMLYGAMDELRLGNPWDLSTDVGPVIDPQAQDKIVAHIENARADGRVLKQLNANNTGWFVPPTVISVNGIADMKEEIFGPVLHVARYKSDQLDQIISDINATGYGLTFGLHTRIDDRVQHIVDAIHAGNIYVNRNQIGAIVGSQPFGGHGMSGTGPKAGGPLYLGRFAKNANLNPTVAQISLPGPTGESNRLSFHPVGRVLCLGPDVEAQSKIVREYGCEPMTTGDVETGDFNAVAFWGDEASAKEIRQKLAQRKGAIIGLLRDETMGQYLTMERHVCVDTTAAGGNAALLGGTAVDDMPA
ncbi:bifunctional proline dehydrogenase/L-glutamate gamma-semialdehyde dehydrogenase [Amylibacter kogurei]|uniref:Bifunctional protein PutA n=1 Tax=Paramylibacter kogurei TaxID=1889778 RepID=A0A2G5K137_9RHOB|nr:bifunctional proline dehydrogenase/L-glutamate gamma-semialdehyde dehydrogenase PutA [Amylibacter kogurei]PIB23145.1 bifunctional proline dehydrogenase/L-glutamate gamma-semialdehyde dehydrogenase [Amylibacter kogurei]